MSKIICDICGTAYPDTANECPICGCTKAESAALLADDLLEEEVTASAAPEAGQFAAAAGKKALVPEDEDDEYDDEEDEEDEDDEEDDEDEEEDGHKSNAPLVILLVLVILALLAVSAFILVKYFLPNVMGPEETAPSGVETTAAVEDTTELKIPCENLALTSGGEIVLDAEGANWLINVLALPDNTTDVIVYSSSDEAVATVNEQGKVTAVGEGTAVITITCGEQELKCTVTVTFAPETTAAPVETTVPVDVSEPSEPVDATEPSEPEETTQPTEPAAPLKDIDLAKAINYKELTFNGPNQGVNIKIKGLDAKEVKWSSEDEKVATVDENGRILNTGKGTTYIVVKYGEQEFKIKIICKW